MPDSATEAAPVAPADPQTSIQPAPVAPAAAPAAQAPAPAAPIGITSEQLKARLDEERQKTAARVKAEAEAEFLKSLGVAKLDEAKDKIEAQKKLEAERLSEIERRDKAIEELKPKAERASTLEQVVKRQAEAALSGLTEAQKAAVQRIAGDDPVRVWDALEALRPTWVVATPEPVAVQQQEPSAATPPAPPKPLPAGATTMPAPRAPSPSEPTQVTESHLATWERLKTEHPVKAAQYYLQNSVAIIAAQKARSA